MNREQLFKSIAGQGENGGFFVGESLPEELGRLGEILVIEIAAVPNISAEAVVTNIISAISKQPVARNLVQRYRQFKKLIETAYVEYRHIVIVFNNAQLLPPRTIKPLKSMRENCCFPCPGILFIGDKTKIIQKLKPIQTIYMRSVEINQKGNLELLYKIPAQIDDRLKMDQ